jgi:hypothetical protein
MRKIIKKFFTSQGPPKGAALYSFILNIKKDFDYLTFGQWNNNSERL